MKILYFYPENPLLFTQGNNARANKLLEYFKSRNIEVDFVGEETKEFTIEDSKKLVKNGLVKRAFLLLLFRRSKNQLKYFFFKSLPRVINRELKDFDRVKPKQSIQFKKIISENNYDYIIISYGYWHKLIDKIDKKNAKLIIDTHDFLTSQFQNNKKFNLGRYFETEIKILNKFDEIFVISIDEKFTLSQFIKKPIHIIAHGLPAKNIIKNKEIDVIYVASDNEHNVAAAKWFFEKVYPLLTKNIKITVVGKITKYINDYENVTKIGFINDLDDAYATSKIAICPMLSGTGLKIKVAEALSFGLPIVCNERGIDGLLNKTKNGCLVTNNEIEFANNITKLLENSDYYSEISNEAKTFFNETLNSDVVYKNLDAIFKTEQ